MAQSKLLLNTEYVLFHTLMVSPPSGGRPVLTPVILPGQPGFESQLALPLDEVSITADLVALTRRPAGSFFVSNDYTRLSDEQVHINTFTALIMSDGNPLPQGGALSEEAKKQVDVLLTYLHYSDDPKYDADFVKDVEDGFSTYGYQVDWLRLLEVEQPGPNAHILEGSLVEELLQKYPKPDEMDTGFFIADEVWQDMVYDRHKCQNVLLVGPTGCGKTELMSHVSKAFGEELFIQDMGTVQDVQSAMIGVHRLDHNNHSLFDPAPFVGYIRSGQEVLLDEINRAPLSAQNITFPCLDSRRYLPLDIAGESEERHVKVHENTWFVGTANIGAQYGATQEIDRAFKDRFHIIELDYLRPEDEIRILIKRTGIDRKNAESLVSLANQTREWARSQDISEAVSTRHTIQTAQRVADGYSLVGAVRSVIYPLYENETEDSEREKIIGLTAQF